MRMRQAYTIFAASAILLAAPVGVVGPGLAAAALSPADCDSDRIVFTSQADVAAANCSAARGDVVIPATATGNITFDFLFTIGGDLITEPCPDDKPDCATVGGITSSNLTTINGRLRISDVASLQSVVLPGLREVKGALELTRLPALTTLNIKGINRVGSFHLIEARALRRAEIGKNGISLDPDVGLKNITDLNNQVVEVRGAGLEGLDGLIDFWDAKLFSVEDMPNLQVHFIRVGTVDEVRVSGNGNMTLRFWDAHMGTPGPFINKLVVSGVRHLSPCFNPTVHEFVLVDNPIEYLHFNFDSLSRFEVRNNLQLKTMVPWTDLNRFWRDIVIRDNPLLGLSTFPKRSPDDNLTAYECPDLYESRRDQWRWFPNRFNSVVISADVDNTFFNKSFADLYLNASEKSATKPKVLKLFEVNSTNASFTCEELDILRSEKGAFPGKYSCQGKTRRSGGYSGAAAIGTGLLTVFGAVLFSALMVM